MKKSLFFLFCLFCFAQDSRVPGNITRICLGPDTPENSKNCRNYGSPQRAGGDSHGGGSSGSGSSGSGSSGGGASGGGFTGGRSLSNPFAGMKGWTPPSVFRGISGDPELDAQYRKALFSHLSEGQSPATRAHYNRLSELLNKYGSAEKAAVGLSQELRANLQKEIAAAMAQVPASDEAMPPRLPRGIDARAYQKVMGPVFAAAEARNPFALTDAIDRLAERVEKSHPDYRARWKGITDGVVTNSDGLLVGLPGAEPLVRLGSNWTSPEGRRIRSALNQVIAAEAILEGEYSNYCKEKGGKACEDAKPVFDSLRDRYVALSMTGALADRFALDRDTEAFNQAVAPLESAAHFGKGVVEGIYGSGKELLTSVTHLVTHPIQGTKEIARGLASALYHYDRTYAALKAAVDQNIDVVLTGTAEERGKLVGKVSLELAVMLIPGGVVSKAGSKTLNSATGTALTVLAVEEGSRRAVALRSLSKLGGKVLEQTGKYLPQWSREMLVKGGDVLDPLAGSSVARKTRELLAMEDAELASLARHSPSDAVELVNEAIRATPKQLTLTANKAEDILASAKQAAPQVMDEVGKKFPGEAERFARLIDESKDIEIQKKYGPPARQEMGLDALAARDQVNQGKRIVYRQGAYGGKSKTNTARPDFKNSPTEWSFESPLTTPNYSDKYGIYSLKPEFIEIGVIDQNSVFITRAAEPGRVELPSGQFRQTPGGGIEVVVPPGGVRMTRHIHLD